jgi:hypothetical protein
LRAWSLADRQQLASGLRSAVGRWARAWSLHAAPWLDSDIVIEDASCAREAIESFGWQAGGVAGVWWSLTTSGTDRSRTDTPRRALLSALFGESKKPLSAVDNVRICDQLADDAWRACLIEFGRLVAAQAIGENDALDDAARSIDPELMRPFGGALLARLPWCGQALALLLDGDRVARALNRSTAPASATRALRRQAIAPLSEALSRRALSVRIELQPIDIDLGSMAELRLGDVLCTSHRLTEPLALRASSTGPDNEPNPLCAVFLGRQSRWRAVELRRPVPDLTH